MSNLTSLSAKSLLVRYFFYTLQTKVYKKKDFHLEKNFNFLKSVHKKAPQ